MFQEKLSQCPAIAILRGVTPDEVCAVCDILLEAGITLLEIPLNSPNPCESIARAAAHAAGRQLVGAGTVLSTADVQNVHAAGGAFVISPNTDPDVIRETVRLGMLSIPGFFTATEAFAACKAGADYLKLFPAGQLGPSYIKDLKAVVKKPILAVGGVNAANIPAFLDVCCGVGIGSAIYKPGKTPEQLRADAIAIARAATAPRA